MRRGPEGLPYSPRERNFFETGDSPVQPYFSATSKKDPKFWRSNSNCECPEVETPDGDDNAALCDGYSSVGVVFHRNIRKIISPRYPNFPESQPG